MNAFPNPLPFSARLTRLFLPSMALLAALPLCAQGDLDPAGPPAPLMKRLDQLNAGTPIDALPAVLGAPGRYYLTRDLVATPGTTGVRIISSHVTLDLNGFRIWSASTGVLAEGAADAELVNVVIRNGTIGRGANGVRLSHTCQSTVEDLSLLDVSTGVVVQAAGGGRSEGNRIERCAILDGVYGVRLLGTDGGVCRANTIRSCTMNDLSLRGIFLDGSAGQCDANTIVDCLIGEVTGSEGISFDAGDSGHCDANVITRCALAACATGIRIESGTGGTIDGNTIELCTVTGTSADFSQSILVSGVHGSCRGNRVSETCTSSGKSSGISIFGTETGTEGNVIERCVVNNVTRNGIQLLQVIGCRVADNHVTVLRNDANGMAPTGISTANGSRSVLVNNSTGGIGQAFSILATDTFGPYVNNSGTLPATGNAVHPWANFLR